MRQLAIIFCCLFLSACDLVLPKPEVVTLKGITMGTSYTIKAVDVPEGVTPEALYEKVYDDLDAVNTEFSNWKPESVVVQFNESRNTDWISVSKHFETVFESASELHTLSGGRFDVTVAPLIDLWGFGPSDQMREPKQEELEAALKSVGMTKHIEFDAAGQRLRKISPEVSMNFSAIAKGYGADVIANTLNQIGVENYMVEIGGDLIVKGVNASGKPWRVAIEKPLDDGRAIELVLDLTDLAMASSGDYRNFYVKNGQRFSHIIDPVTGRPVTHNLASVTVVSENAMTADGLATALLVLGEKRGMEIAEMFNISAYFIQRTEDGFTQSYSSSFERFVKPTN